MVSIYYNWFWCNCILAAVMSFFWGYGTCLDGIKLRIKQGRQGYSYAYCRAPNSWNNINMMEIDYENATYGCSCTLLISKGDRLTIKNPKSMTEYKTFHLTKEEDNLFSLGFITDGNGGYIYMKEMEGQNQPWQYSFKGIVNFTPKDENDSMLLTCKNVSKSDIYNLGKLPVTTSTATAAIVTEHPTTPIINTDHGLPQSEKPTQTDHGVPVSEKPTQAPRKAIVIPVVIGVVLLVVIAFLVTIIICCLKRRKKSPRDIPKGQYVPVSIGDGDNPGDQEGVALVSNKNIQPSILPAQLNTPAGDQVEYAEIKPGSVAPKTAPDGHDQTLPGGDAGKPLVYADLAFHNDPTGDGNGKGETGVGTAGAGMTDDQISQLYAKPMKRK